MFLVVSLGCSDGRAPIARNAPRAGNDTIIQIEGGETVHPMLLATAYLNSFALAAEFAEGLARPSVYCLAMSNRTTPPPAAVIDRLEANRPASVPATRCLVNESTKRYAVQDRTTGDRGWLVFVDSISRVDSTQWRVSSGYYVEPLFAAWWTCLISRDDDSWKVSQCTWDRVS
jgi:hypothetical protein